VGIVSKVCLVPALPSATGCDQRPTEIVEGASKAVGDRTNNPTLEKASEFFGPDSYIVCVVSPLGRRLDRVAGVRAGSARQCAANDVQYTDARDTRCRRRQNPEQRRLPLQRPRTAIQHHKLEQHKHVFLPPGAHDDRSADGQYFDIKMNDGPPTPAAAE